MATLRGGDGAMRIYVAFPMPVYSDDDGRRFTALLLSALELAAANPSGLRLEDFLAQIAQTNH